MYVYFIGQLLIDAALMQEKLASPLPRSHTPRQAHWNYQVCTLLSFAAILSWSSATLPPVKQSVSLSSQFSNQAGQAPRFQTSLSEFDIMKQKASGLFPGAGLGFRQAEAWQASAIYCWDDAVSPSEARQRQKGKKEVLYDVWQEGSDNKMTANCVS